MGFAGWAPEVINCRAGMVAFVAAMGAEMQSYNHETFGRAIARPRVFPRFCEFIDHRGFVYAVDAKRGEVHVEAVVQTVRDFYPGS